MSPADIRLVVCFCLGGFFASLKFCFVETGPQHIPRHRPVLVLGSVILTLHNDAGRLMRQAHSTVRFVDVLPASTRCAIGIRSYIALDDINVYRIIDQRVHPDTRKAGMTPCA